VVIERSVTCRRLIGRLVGEIRIEHFAMSNEIEAVAGESSRPNDQGFFFNRIYKKVIRYLRRRPNGEVDGETS